MDPAPIANITINCPDDESNPMVSNMGLIKAAVVKTAMVDEPWAILRKEAIKKGIKRPNPIPPSH